MASSNNSIAENKKAKKPETSTPTSKIKKEKDVEKSSEKKKKNNEEIKSNKSKKLKFANGNSKEKEDNGIKHENDIEEEEEAKTNVFPMSRIRTIIKAEISDLRVTQEAILAINKAAEKFLEQLALEAYACCAQDRKKYLSYNHLSNVVSKQKRFDFLSDFVPEKVKAEDALRETISRGERGG
ncbi:DNA polymerase II subunit B3-1-like [Vicia villosa]|uniref:DNA polymerase II subunit B3-1-like n=1 Tax=Vicia villosa TaxID=3911 RepID=UPI00273C7501|nr:DNA polymerase II subunit B3-1-like [Vicia villosa]